jgi:hypothetical protein
MDEVLARAMTRKPEPIEWDDASRGQIAEDRIGGRALTFLGQQSLS